MQMQLKVNPEVWDELDAISDKHLMLSGVNSARKITHKILDELDILKNNPFIGTECNEYPLTGKGFRRLICGNYLCFYKLTGDSIYVYHIVDGRTNYPKLFENALDK